MPPPAHGLASRLITGPTLRTQSDRRLVKLVREGYENAFEEIVRRYGRALGRYAAGRGRRSTGARRALRDGAGMLVPLPLLKALLGPKGSAAAEAADGGGSGPSGTSSSNSS